MTNPRRLKQERLLLRTSSKNTSAFTCYCTRYSPPHKLIQYVSSPEDLNFGSWRTWCSKLPVWCYRNAIGLMLQTPHDEKQNSSAISYPFFLPNTIWGVGDSTDRWIIASMDSDPSTSRPIVPMSTICRFGSLTAIHRILSIQLSPCLLPAFLLTIGLAFSVLLVQLLQILCYVSDPGGNLLEEGSTKVYWLVSIFAFREGNWTRQRIHFGHKCKNHETQVCLQAVNRQASYSLILLATC